MTRLAGILALAGLIVGLLVGYLSWGTAGRRAGQEKVAAQSQLAEAQARGDTLERRVGALEAELKQIRGDLEAERQLRQKYETVVNVGRK